VPHITTLIIGAGQAGLAMSRCLSDLSIDHLVVERGRVAERWRSQSWNSLHLLTPNWMTRLPGFRYDGDSPDAFMSVPDLIALLERYSAASSAPVLTETTVHRVERGGGRFSVATNRGTWSSDSVVIATGYCDLPAVPAAARSLGPAVTQIVPASYRRPELLPDGGVLVVGASSTGVQIADEIQHSGRQVTLAVGRHTRLPRRYRGRDILWWLDQLGVLSQPADAVHSIEISRQQPSLQLVGRPDHSSVDLGSLHNSGVRLVGRVQNIDGYRVHLSDDVVATAASGDIKMADVLMRIDGFIGRAGMDAEPAEPFKPTWSLVHDSVTQLDLRAQGIKTVIWATGFRRAYPWLQIPEALDRRGELAHHGGVTPVPGLYALGLNFQRRRNSSFIDGVGDDARAIAGHVAQALVCGRVA
jgi:putative flavoprotein involved in K+ transport